ncbi:MAG: hypothetical protein V4486_02230 [Patescibacteria group bacterium]
MKFSPGLKMGIIVLLVAGASFGFFRYYKTSGKSGNSDRIVFQPDSQVLNSAVNPEGVVADKNIDLSNYDSKVCAGAPFTYNCFSEYYKNLVKTSGVTLATADMKKRAAENPSVLSQCHPLMHVIGRAAVGNYKTISEAFANGDSYCWSGYFHGVMEGMVAKIGLSNLPKELNNICADIPGKANYTFDYFNCVHGLGHGVMALLEDDVFDSLKMCDNLSGNWEEESCYGGVFMQNIIDSTNVADTDNIVKDLKPKEPLYPCTAVDTKYKGQCYLGQTSYALQVTGYDYKKVFALCTTVEAPYRDICNQSMGRDVANQAMHEKMRTKELCSIAKDPNDFNNCVIGAVKEIISYYHSDKQALEFCSVLTGEGERICTDTANAYYRNF